MSSKRKEEEHLNLIRDLLYANELVCTAPPHVSPESSLDEEEVRVEAAVEEVAEEEVKQVEQVIEEDKAPPVEEEQEVHVFPTPSLRRVIPEELRKIEALNRIHVLPENFKSKIDPAAIPRIDKTPPQKYIDALGEITGCSMYKSSLPEFWFLDTLANLLRRAQADGLDRPAQAVLILWFCEWMREMQHFDAADRQRMLRRWKDNMLGAAKYVAQQSHVPTPDDIGVTYKSDAESEQNLSRNALSDMEKFEKEKSELEDAGKEQAAKKEKVEKAGKAEKMGKADKTTKERPLSPTERFTCSMRDLSKIIHYIYDLFSTDFQYNLVRSVFTFTPECHVIDAPYQIQRPKRIYQHLRLKKEKKSQLSIKKEKSMPKLKKGKTKITTDLTAEYLEMMEGRAKHIKEQEEIYEMEMEEYNKRSHILPLQFAATQDFFEQYWPPTPHEAEPETTVSEPAEKKKGKKKKK